MSDSLLLKTIHQNNPEKIERYLKNKLSNDPQNLQRIYHELEQFSSNLNKIIQSNSQAWKKIDLASAKKQKQLKTQNRYGSRPIKLHTNTKQLPFSGRADAYFQRNKQQNITKRQQILIRNLKERGLRATSEHLPLGMKVFQKEERRISKPLQSNKSLVFKETTPVIKCLKRFNLNRNFYSNTIVGATIDAEKYYDREMKEFIDRRTYSLKKITAKEQFDSESKLANLKKFLHVGTKISDDTHASLPLHTMRSAPNKNCVDPQQRVSKLKEYKKRKQIQAQNLIRYCTGTLQQVADHGPKSLISQQIKYQKVRQSTQNIINQMRTMQAKLDEQNSQLSDDRLQISQLGIRNEKLIMIDKYTLNYIKSIRNTSKNQSIINNKNDLIKNQAKYRNLIAERKD